MSKLRTWTIPVNPETRNLVFSQAAISLPVELIKVVDAKDYEKAVECLESLKKQFDWYLNTFNGPGHEFEHWWRVEAPDQIDQTLRELGFEIK